jgi:undecaprenyl-diphosphatase
MTPARVAALGVVQGVAEVVPVSSSAQLVLLPWLLGWPPPADRTTFAAGLHAGSCLGIAFALRAEVRALDLRTTALLAGATVPAAVAGLLAADAVEQRLGRPPQLAALLASAGALLWWADARAARSGGAVGPREAAYAGLAQVAALVPGVSRSGATLTALRLAGVDRAAAHRFTLLLSLPVTAGAAVLTLVRTPRSRLASSVRLLAPGAVTAAVAGATTVTALDTRGEAVVRGAALYRLGLAVATARQLHRRRAR